MKYYELRGKLARIRDDFDGKLIVVGDLHGDLKSFERVRDIFLQIPDSILIFLGDYADRGSFGIEVIEGVKELLIDFPDRTIALKGNHEDYKMGMPNFAPCDLPREVEIKRGISWRDFFPQFEREFLSRLQLAVWVPSYALLVHGGISSKIRNLSDLESPSEGVEEDVLWSDPYEGTGEHPNPRGAGILFGPDVTKSVAGRVKVKYILRSHEPRKALTGPFAEHGGRVITLSSTRIYGGIPFVLSFDVGAQLSGENLRLMTRYLADAGDL